MSVNRSRDLFIFIIIAILVIVPSIHAQGKRTVPAKGQFKVYISADMEGKALTELFSRDLKVEFEPPREHLPIGAEEEVYSEQEKKLLTQRLADLGYLE